MKKTFIFLLFLFSMTTNVYASYVVHYYKAGPPEEDEYVKANTLCEKKLEITNSVVTLNEDDNNYIFNVSQDMECKSLNCNYTYSFVVPDIVLASFKSIDKLSIYSSNRTMNNSVLSIDLINEYAKLNSEEVAVFYDKTTHNNNTGNVEYEVRKRCSRTFYLTDPNANCLVTKKDFDTTPHNVSCSRSHSYTTKQNKVGDITYRYGEFYLHVDYVIKIKKEEIENYRYMATYITMAFSQNNDKEEINVKKTYLNLCSTSIDLYEAVEAHTHDFKIREIYKDYHELFCEGCKWLRRINHNYIGSYDDIDNNLCECGKHKYIKLHIENNIDDTLYEGLVEVFDTFPIYNLDKTGHTLKYIKWEEKIGDNINEYSKYDDLVLPSLIPNNSIKYYIYYDVNVYKMRFNKDNNLKLDFTNIEKMDDMVFAYGENKALSKCTYLLDGYEFLGWGLNEPYTYDAEIDPMSRVEFVDEEEIENFTLEDDAVFNLYPLYRIINFEVTYKSNVNNQILLIKKYNLYSNESFPSYKGFSVNSGQYRFGIWTVNGETIKPANTNSLLKYVKKDNDKINVIARFYEYKDGYQYDDGSGKGPIEKDDKNNSGGVNDNGIYETTITINLIDNNETSIVSEENLIQESTIGIIETDSDNKKESDENDVDTKKSINDDGDIDEDLEDIVKEGEEGDEDNEDNEEDEKGLYDIEDNEDGSGGQGKDGSLLAKELILNMGLNRAMLLTFLIGGIITFYYILLFIVFMLKKIRAEFSKNNL